jgi:hypothetical protein
MIIPESGKSSSSRQSRHASVDGAGSPRSSTTSTPRYYNNSHSLDSFPIDEPVPEDAVPPEYSPRARPPVNDHRRVAVYNDVSWNTSSVEEAGSSVPCEYERLAH